MAKKIKQKKIEKKGKAPKKKGQKAVKLKSKKSPAKKNAKKISSNKEIAKKESSKMLSSKKESLEKESIKKSTVKSELEEEAVEAISGKKDSRVKLVDVKCPECDEHFEIDQNKYDDGDITECPECNAILTIAVRSGKLVLLGEKEKYYGEEDEAEDEELPADE